MSEPQARRKFDNPHNQKIADLSAEAADRAGQMMIDMLKRCDSIDQAKFVCMSIVSTVAAQTGAVILADADVDYRGFRPYELLRMVADTMETVLTGKAQERCAANLH